MWHTVKKAAYVQTEFLVHGKSGYIVFQVYGFNKTRGFKMGDDSGELSLGSWNVIFFLCSYESFFVWCRENDLILYLQGRGRKKYGRTREEHCSIDTHTHTHKKTTKKRHNHEHVGWKEVLSDSLRTFRLPVSSTQKLNLTGRPSWYSFGMMNLGLKPPL